MMAVMVIDGILNTEKEERGGRREKEVGKMG